MTLPAHRFLERAPEPGVEERKKGDGGKKQRVWTFDFDETITKSPRRCRRIAKGLRKLGDRVVVVTGNTSQRDQLIDRLNDYKFPFDDLIQYQDDQTDGIKRLDILKQLDAWGAFDDRMGRAPTLVQQCPHFFLAAKPPKPARKRAKGGKKQAKKKVKKMRDAEPPVETRDDE